MERVRRLEGKLHLAWMAATVHVAVFRVGVDFGRD